MSQAKHTRLLKNQEADSDDEASPSKVQDMTKMINCLRDEEGATAIEYGLIAGLIAVVIIAAVTLLGGDIAAVFTGISDAI